MRLQAHTVPQAHGMPCETPATPPRRRCCRGCGKRGVRVKVYGVVACGVCCVAACNITASCAKPQRPTSRNPRGIAQETVMSCALAGKHRHQVNVHHLAVRGSKTGRVMRRPSAFCCEVAARQGVFNSGAKHGCFRRGQHATPTPPALCGRGLATTACVVGGGFPLTPPNPLAGKCSKSMPAPVRVAPPGPCNPAFTQTGRRCASCRARWTGQRPGEATLKKSQKQTQKQTSS